MDAEKNLEQSKVLVDPGIIRKEESDGERKARDGSLTAPPLAGSRGRSLTVADPGILERDRAG